MELKNITIWKMALTIIFVNLIWLGFLVSKIALENNQSERIGYIVSFAILFIAIVILSIIQITMGSELNNVWAKYSGSAFLLSIISLGIGMVVSFFVDLYIMVSPDSHKGKIYSEEHIQHKVNINENKETEESNHEKHHDKKHDDSHGKDIVKMKGIINKVKINGNTALFNIGTGYKYSSNPTITDTYQAKYVFSDRFKKEKLKNFTEAFFEGYFQEGYWGEKIFIVKHIDFL